MEVFLPGEMKEVRPDQGCRVTRGRVERVLDPEGNNPAAVPRERLGDYFWRCVYWIIAWLSLAKRDPHEL